MNACCVFSLEFPHWGNSNEFTQHAIININKKITLNCPKYNNVCNYGIFSLGTQGEFEKAMVNEPSVFEPLKFYPNYGSIPDADALKKKNQFSGKAIFPWK